MMASQGQLASARLPCQPPDYHRVRGHAYGPIFFSPVIALYNAVVLGRRRASWATSAVAYVFFVVYTTWLAPVPDLRPGPPRLADQAHIPGNLALRRHVWDTHRVYEDTKGHILMVMTSRRRPADLRPSPETESRPLPGTARELFDALPQLPGLRTEIIDGRLIVSPVGTPEHGWLAMLLSYELHQLVMDRDWHTYAGNVDVCIDGPRDPVEPDFVLAPADCPRWGTRELLSSGLLMVAEIVSPGSVHDDRDRKPGIYASGLVPVMLLIDPVATPATVTVLSDPKEGEYQTFTRVTVGSPLHLPEPVGFTLETSVFKKALGNP